ncbi:charged multivesicular body protein 4b-like [Betta splendens]|uniref:Charged multivesicular body protein 4b-like n=1 Tax=Betta splendens TaxID=158456 RepID=A0A6P7MTQ5_BETSP|nr:charged multivesicular body protein 4b-like [Betta splendens]
MLIGRQKETVKPSQPDTTQTLHLGEGLLLKKEEFLRKQMWQELILAKNNCRTNRRGALQALRRKKWYENQLKCVACAVRAVQFVREYVDIVNKMNDLIKDITEKPDVAQDAFYTSADFGVDLDEEELLTELEMLEMTVDDKSKAPCVQVLAAVSPSTGMKRVEQVRPWTLGPDNTEEDELEGDLERLWRWANETP